MNLNVIGYVSKADGKQIRVNVFDKSIKKQLTNLGFIYDEQLGEYIINTLNVTEKANIFNQLRSFDICFSGGKEWCPSEVFEYLREKKLLSGKFQKIYWLSPDNFEIKII